MNGNKLIFKKLAALWNSSKKDKNGKVFMQGTVEEDIALKKGDRVFVFQASFRNKATSPIATVTVGIQEQEEELKEETPAQGPEPWDEGQNVQGEDEKKEPGVPDDCPF